MAALQKPFLTPEQYLEIERRADVKSEYLSGQMFQMAGGSPDHALITGNLIGELRAQLKGRPCRAYSSDLRVTIMPMGLRTYPDVTVLCGEPHFHPLDLDSLINPTVIVEVLSPSTESYDRGEKFAHYRRLASLQEYILVSQERIRVERFVRQENGAWLMTEFSLPTEALPLESLGVSIPLTEIYDKIQFSPTLSMNEEEQHG